MAREGLINTASSLLSFSFGPGSDNGKTLDLGSGDLGSNYRSATHWLMSTGQNHFATQRQIKLPHL